MRTVDVVVPAWVDDPGRPSGGSTYDRRMCDGLRALGWAVRRRPVPGDWPHPDRAARTALADVLRQVPDGTAALLDGILASPAPEVVAGAGARLPVVVLVHLPLGVGAVPAVVREAEHRALWAAAAVVVPSVWTRDWLQRAYGLPRSRLAVVPPGTDRADLAHVDTAGTRLLCVGAVSPVKGQDLLVDALADLRDLHWSCTLVGSTTADPEFAQRVRRRADATGIASRLRIAGVVTRSGLGLEYARTDLLVSASRAETYGMVVAEALARGIPVIAPEVGGLPEALGRISGGRPGVLVPPGDSRALAAALRRWLTDATLRQELRAAAARRRARLVRWARPASSLSGLLEEVAA